MKNKMMVLGGLVLAVVFTAFQVSGTYAKYVSSTDVIDDARIAKWNIAISNPVTLNEDLFKSSYVYDGDSKTYVKSVDDKDVVAPGTTGTYSVKFTGQVETAFVYDFKLEEIPDFYVKYNSVTGNLDADGDKEYHPLKYRAYIIQPGDVKVWANNDTTSNAWVTADELKNFFNVKYKNDNSGTYKFVYSPVGNLNQTLVIEWKWDTNSTEGSLSADQVNVLDTYLGKNLYTSSQNFKMTVAAVQYTADDKAQSTNTNYSK